MVADDFFIVGGDDEDRAQEGERLQAQSIRPLHQYRFFETVFALRAGIIDPRQRAHGAKLLAPLAERLDQPARLPLGHGWLR